MPHILPPAPTELTNCSVKMEPKDSRDLRQLDVRLSLKNGKCKDMTRFIRRCRMATGRYNESCVNFLDTWLGIYIRSYFVHRRCGNSKYDGYPTCQAIWKDMQTRKHTSLDKESSHTAMGKEFSPLPILSLFRNLCWFITVTHTYKSMFSKDMGDKERQRVRKGRKPHRIMAPEHSFVQTWSINSCANL